MWFLEEGASQGSAPLFIVSMSPPDYPSAWLRPRSAASVSPGKSIVAPPRPARTTSGYAVSREGNLPEWRNTLGSPSIPVQKRPVGLFCGFLGNLFREIGQEGPFREFCTLSSVKASADQFHQVVSDSCNKQKIADNRQNQILSSSVHHLFGRPRLNPMQAQLVVAAEIHWSRP